jgi:hypothetical protein
VTGRSRKLLTLQYEWLPGSTGKYALDSLLGVCWERVLRNEFNSFSVSVCTSEGALRGEQKAEIVERPLYRVPNGRSRFGSCDCLTLAVLGSPPREMMVMCG